VAQGQTVLVSAGDDGAAGLVFDSTSKTCVPGTTRNVNEVSADPNVTSVGGTGFTPAYDSSGNNAGLVAESAWNDAACCRGGATGGGASAVYAKPSYQGGVTPNDGQRDVPDIALIASPFHPGVWWVTDSAKTPLLTCCIGATSLSAPMWAGLIKVIGQLRGGTGLGNVNPGIYQLAGGDLAANGFRDVTSGGKNTFNGVIGLGCRNRLRPVHRMGHGGYGDVRGGLCRHDKYPNYDAIADLERDTGADSDAKRNADPDAKRDTDANAEWNADANTERDTDTNTERNADTDTERDPNADAKRDADANVKRDADTHIEGDADADFSGHADLRPQPGL